MIRIAYHNQLQWGKLVNSLYQLCSTNKTSAENRAGFIKIKHEWQSFGEVYAAVFETNHVIYHNVAVDY